MVWYEIVWYSMLNMICVWYRMQLGCFAITQSCTARGHTCCSSLTEVPCLMSTSSIHVIFKTFVFVYLCNCVFVYLCICVFVHALAWWKSCVIHNMDDVDSTSNCIRFYFLVLVLVFFFMFLCICLFVFSVLCLKSTWSIQLHQIVISAPASLNSLGMHKLLSSNRNFLEIKLDPFENIKAITSSWNPYIWEY